MRGKDGIEKQIKFVETEGGCQCLIHHPVDPKRRAMALEMVRSGNPSEAVIALNMLGPCPTRNKEN